MQLSQLQKNITMSAKTIETIVATLFADRNGKQKKPWNLKWFVSHSWAVCLLNFDRCLISLRELEGSRLNLLQKLWKSSAGLDD